MMRFENQRAEIRLKSQILLLPCLNLNVVKLFWLNLFLIYDFFPPCDTLCRVYTTGIGGSPTTKWICRREWNYLCSVKDQ